MATLNGHEAGNGGHGQGDSKNAARLFPFSAPLIRSQHAAIWLIGIGPVSDPRRRPAPIALRPVLGEVVKV